MKASRRPLPAVLLAALVASLWVAPAAVAGHDYHGGTHLGIWLGLPPPIVEPGYLHGYPGYPRSHGGHPYYRHRHRHHGGDSDSDSDSGHRHHHGCR